MGPQAKIQKLKELVRLGVIGAKDSSSKCLLAISREHREQWAKTLRKVHVSNNIKHYHPQDFLWHSRMVNKIG